jgi:hypothetical protein
MKNISKIAQILLGLLFTVFGLNGFLHFLSMGPMPSGAAGQFMAALFQSHYISVVFGVELLTGLMLLVGVYVPLALAALGPVIVNIVLYHVLMAPAGLPLATVAVLLWIIAAYNFRPVFAAFWQSPLQEKRQSGPPAAERMPAREWMEEPKDPRVRAQ